MILKRALTRLYYKKAGSNLESYTALLVKNLQLSTSTKAIEDARTSKSTPKFYH